METWYSSQVRVFQQEFDRQDKYNRGCLPLVQVYQALVGGGFRGSEGDVLTLLNGVELDEDDHVTRDDFLEAIRQPIRSTLQP